MYVAIKSQIIKSTIINNILILNIRYYIYIIIKIIQDAVELSLLDVY